MEVLDLKSYKVKIVIDVFIGVHWCVNPLIV